MKSLANAPTATNKALTIIETGIKRTKASSAETGFTVMVTPGIILMLEKVRARLARLIRVAIVEMPHTARNLPAMISSESMGAHSRVCMVPRSFSPAVMSMAA